MNLFGINEMVYLGVVNGKCKTARLTFFPCDPETLKCFKCEREISRLLKLKFELMSLYRSLTAKPSVSSKFCGIHTIKD